MTTVEKIESLIQEVDKLQPLDKVVEGLSDDKKLIGHILKSYRNVVIMTTASIMIDREGKL
jgi:SepF-like predicted cell division protein (DUF552 family)